MLIPTPDKYHVGKPAVLQEGLVALTRKRGDDKDKARALVMIKLWLQVTDYMGGLGKDRAGQEDGKDGKDGV